VNLLGGNPTGSGLYINSLWDSVQITQANLGSGVAVGLPNVRLAGAKNVSIVNSIIAGGGSGGPNDVAIRLDADGSTPVTNFSLRGSQVGWSQAHTTGSNSGVYAVDASAHAHTAILQGNDLYGSTDALGLQNIAAGAAVLLRGNKISNGTKPACSAVYRGSDWETQGGGGVADSLEVCKKAADASYAWTALY
jgi:hypothetical protein